MTTDNRMIGWLNRALQHELGAVQQYLAQSALTRLMGDETSALRWRETALEELSHAEHLMQRLLQLGAAPSAGTVAPVRLGRGPQDFDAIDDHLEREAVRLYQDAAEHARRVRDAQTESLLRQLLQDEIRHLARQSPTP